MIVIDQIANLDMAIYLKLMKHANVASREAIRFDRLGNHGLARVRRQDARALRAWAALELRG